MVTKEFWPAPFNKLTFFLPFRGINLGKPELQKTWEKFEHKKTAKEQKQETTKNELEARFETISQKNRVGTVGWSGGGGGGGALCKLLSGGVPLILWNPDPV